MVFGGIFQRVSEEVESGKEDRYQERKGRQRKKHNRKVKDNKGRKEGKEGRERKRDTEIYFLRFKFLSSHMMVLLFSVLLRT